MILFAGIVTALYGFLMLFLLFGVHKLPEFFGNKTAPKNTFSIVIPFRNEAEKLPQLLQSLSLLKYPPEMFEILLVNDASEDTSEAICRNFLQEHPELQVSLLQNEISTGSPKKDAVKKAISVSQYEYIITTDADCIVPEHWLREFNSHLLETDAAVVAAPVRISSGEVPKPILKRFQEIDFFSLQAATMGGFGVQLPFMCNAANFCYSKKVFLDLNGFSGNDHIAGGDDIFLLEKFQKAGYISSFLRSREAVVQTSAQPDFRSLLSQRIRWAGKTSAYKNDFGKFIGVVVFLMNLVLVAAVAAVVAERLEVDVLLMIFLIKFNVDFLLIYSSAKFFQQEKLMKSYFWCSMIYPFFSTAVGVSSLFTGYTWKGRQFKK